MNDSQRTVLVGKLLLLLCAGAVLQGCVPLIVVAGINDAIKASRAPAGKPAGNPESVSRSPQASHTQSGFLPADAGDQLMGDYAGTACEDRRPVKLKVFYAARGVLPMNEFFNVYGELSLPPSSGAAARIYMRGELTVQGGMLVLRNGRPPSIQELVQTYSSFSQTSQDLETTASDPQKKQFFLKRYGAPAVAMHTTPDPPTTLLLRAGPDGSGFRGFLGGLEACNGTEVSLARTGPGKLTGFPAPRAEFASVYGVRLNSRVKGQLHVDSRIFWARRFAALKNYDAPLVLAETLEQRAAPGDFAEALRLLTLQAGEAADHRAQMALARAYAEGRWVPANPSEQGKWQSMADSQRQVLASICRSEVFRAKALSLLKSELQDPDLKLLELVGGLVGGIRMNIGETAIRSVGLGDFSSTNRPFKCQVVSQTLGTSYDSTGESFEYAGQDSDGNDLYIDRRVEQAAADFAASLGNESANRSYRREFALEPTGERAFKVTLIKGPYSVRRTYSDLIRLN